VSTKLSSVQGQAEVIATASFACGFLRNAGLIPELPFSDLWIAMVIVWGLAMFLTSRYYR